MPDLVLGRYQVEGEEQRAGLYSASGVRIATHRAVDVHRGQPVSIKTFGIPEQPALAALARSLWDREMRTAHLAGSSRRSAALLKVVDSRHLPDRRELVLVTERAAHTALEHLRAGAPSRILDPDRRYALWLEIHGLLQSLYALHEVGMLHRNISLSAVFIGGDDEGPLLRLGDYSWTIYLHNLSYHQLGGDNRVRDGAYLRYRAPELRAPNAEGESFATDLYAMGIVIASLVSPSVRRALLDPAGTPFEPLALMRKDSEVTEWERLFFSGMLAEEPTERHDNALRAAESALQVAAQYQKSRLLRCRNPLIVSLNVRPDLEAGQRNIAALSRYFEADGLAGAAPEVVGRDLMGATVYHNGYQETKNGKAPRLFIRGRKAPYSAIPYWDKNRARWSYDVASLAVMSFEPVDLPDAPFAVLDKSIQATTRPWESPNSADTWASLFAAAREVQPPTDAEDPAELFRNNMWLLWHAERGVLSQQFVPVKIARTRPAPPNGGRPIVELAPTPDHHPEYPDLKPLSAEAWWTAQMKEGSFGGYLVEEPSLTDFPDESTRVSILGLSGAGRIDAELGEGRILMEGRTFWLLPGGVKAAIVSLDRKKAALRSSRPDDYLVQVLSDPTRYTVFLEEQKASDVAEQILQTRPLFMVQGPPGTGKTYTATKVIVEALKRGLHNRILVVAQAHKPLDHVLESVRKACINAGFNPPATIVRLAERKEIEQGRTAPIDEDLALLTKQTLGRGLKWKADSPASEAVALKWHEHVDEEIQNPSPAWTDLVLRSANVVFTTSMSSAIKRLESHPPFDLIVVEEAAKAYATDLLGALRLGRNWLLIGDQAQLPPFAFDEMARVVDSLLERDEDYRAMEPEGKARRKVDLHRFLRFFGGLHDTLARGQFPYMPPQASKPAVVLTGQRRLPALLSTLISSIFYERPFEQLEPDRPRPITSPEALAASPLTWIDCTQARSSGQFTERRTTGGIANPGEAELVVNMLRKVKLRPGATVAILSPYSAQVRLLQDLIGRARLPGIGQENVHTVDSFQGREADLVVISLVRNNTLETGNGAVGFLRSPERLNVIMSRARGQLVIIGCLPLLEAFDDASLKTLRKVAAFVRANAPVLTPQTAGVA